VDWKLELIVVPVSDVDRAKAFYIEQAGFGLDVERRDDNSFLSFSDPDGNSWLVQEVRRAP
jgi:catechol 2,3-dioxygenase-like lactoylglutathione lyase family enzyme